MKELIKSEYKNLILVACYIVAAVIAYVICSECLFNKWYIDLICGIVVFIIGATIGYFYIKSERNAKLAKENNEATLEKASEEDTDKIENDKLPEEE